MRKLLNTLYVTRPDAYLSKDGTNVVVTSNGEEAGRLPIHNIVQIVCFGHQGASPALMGLCVENGVSLCFMTPGGRFIASVRGESSGNVLLRREQYRIADDASRSALISRNMVIGKVVNSRAVLRKFKNNHADSKHAPDVDDAILKITSLLDPIGSVEDCASLRSLESEAARSYFGVFDALILKN